MTQSARRRVFVPIILAASGIAPLTNALSKPAVEALRAVDLIGLLAAGGCFGAAIMALALLVIIPRAGD
jgi:hypothetical protein